MVKIRLSRVGKRKKKGRKHLMIFSIVAIDSRKKRDSGAFLDKIGNYNPHIEGIKGLTLNEELLLKWLGNGAKMNITVNNLYNSFKKEKLLNK